ncbi:MAG: site-specific integrase [Planctomycetia bacterium]|nr:site-specific integrase [Planctomycetia bacterium]
MGTVYRKSFTKPLPIGAEIFIRVGQRFARWKDAKGKTRTAPLTTGTGGTDRIAVEARTFTAKYRDGANVVRETATGCRDETAARSVLGDLERRAELVKAGVMTSAENAVADHQSVPLAQHVAAYIAHLTAKGVTKTRIKTTESRLNRVAADRRFNQLSDLNASALVDWLNARAAAGMSPGARNGFREAYIGFCNWCRQSHRLVDNPFANVPKADAKADCRRKRRSLTEAELVKLLDVARRRPLLDAMTIRRGARTGEVAGKLRDDVRERLELLGRERALIYKTLVLTGLRKGELASLTVGQLELDGPTPLVVLHAADEKNRQGSDIPLRSDLAEDLRAWVSDKAKAYEAATQSPTVPFDTEAARTAKRDTLDAAAFKLRLCQQGTKVTRLPAETPLFNVPTGLVRILDRDLKAAGIAKKDERGRTVDVHAMRHTYGTLLSKAGVAPRTAQAAMRHSSIDLTMNVYTDPKLLDVAGALESLPSLPLSGGPQTDRIALKSTGTDGYRSSPLAPPLAPTADESSKSWSSADKSAPMSNGRNVTPRIVTSDEVAKEKRSLTTEVNERQKSGRHDLNMRPLRPEDCQITRRQDFILRNSQHLTACTMH